MDNMKTTVCLGYETREEYSDAFDYFLPAGHKAAIQMDQENFDLPGKGMMKNGKQLYVFQAALPIDVAEDYDRYDTIAGYCRKIGETWTGCCAKPVPTVPDNYKKEMLEAFPEVRENEGNYKRFPIGLNYYSAQPAFFELKDGFIFPIVGNRYIQRWNVMRNLMMDVLRQGWKTILIDTKGIHKDFAEKNGAIFLSSAEDLYKESWNLLEEVNKRCKKRDKLISEAQTEMEELILKEFGPMYVFLDEIRSFYSLLNQPMLEERKVKHFFSQLFSKGHDLGIYMFFGVDSNKKITDDSPGLIGFSSMMEGMRGNFGSNAFLGGNIGESRWFDFSIPMNNLFKYKLDMIGNQNTLVVVENQSIDEDKIIIVPEAT
jgi:hypothetical protein